MKLKFKFNKIIIIFILIFSFLISLFTIYKELKYYNSLELLTQNPAFIDPSANIQNIEQQHRQKLEDMGLLKTINFAQVDNDLTKKVDNQVNNLYNEEIDIKKKLKDLQQKVNDKFKSAGMKVAKDTMSTAATATAHYKPITNSINNHLKALGAPPPTHLVNHPSLPNHNPKVANSWWMPKGNTPQFYNGNYIPIAPTTCSQVQCLPDGFAEAN
jgi:hypothetical protein